MPLPDFASLMHELLDHDSVAVADTATDTRILDATLELIGQYGERRLTIDEVAGRSRVARATIFRRFGSKDALISRLYQREVRAAVALAFAAVAGAPDAGSALSDGYACLLEHVSSHPVIQHLARAEPDITVGLWRDGEPSGLTMVSALLAALAREHSAGAVEPARLEAACDSLARLFLAHLLIPPAPLGSRAGAHERAIREAIIAAGVPHPTPS
jgi:AcrR family transcriptional regulator